MATITTSWTQGTLRSAATLSGSSSDTNDLNLGSNGFDVARITVNMAIGSSTGITVEVFHSTDSGTTDDTVSSMTYVMDSTSVTSFVVKDTEYVAIKITNNSGSATGNISITYSGRKWSST